MYRTIVCPQCNNQFQKDEAQYRREMHTHGNIICGRCGVEITNGGPPTPEKPPTLMSDTVECSECEGRFQYDENYLGTIMCPYCGAKYDGG